MAPDQDLMQVCCMVMPWLADLPSGLQFLAHRSSTEAEQSMDTGHHQSASGMQVTACRDTFGELLHIYIIWGVTIYTLSGELLCL